MSTPPYVPAYIGPQGLVIPSYQSILEDNLQGFLNIYGQNQYVAADSAIYQLLALISLKQSDTNLALQLAYNQSSPQTAVGAGLDRVVKMNGIARLPFTYSTASLTLTGTAGTTINNGFAMDTAGNLWTLPIQVVIPAAQTITVTATCTTPGSVAAEPGQISIKGSPVPGWKTVTNPLAANLGQPVESDSELRARQMISVSLPASTPLQSTAAAILAVPGVARIAPGYPTPDGSGGFGPGTSIENPTSATDTWGNPAHSISMVVDGGDDLAVATAIYSRKTIGCYTNGTTSATVTDPSGNGYQEVIRFYRPTPVPVFVNAVLHGYTGTPSTGVVNDVHDALVQYLNNLQIGETVSISAINYEIMSFNNSLTAPDFGVQTLQIGAPTLGTVDLPMAHFYNVAQGLDANVTVTTA